MRDLRYKDPNRADPKIIGQRIRGSREARGMTQSQLANAVGTSQQTIEKIELGKVQRSSFIYPIYEVLGLSGAPIHNYNPAPRPGETDTRGESFRVRREFLGLEVSELATMGRLSADEITRVEGTKAGDERSPQDWELLFRLDALLARLEGGSPLGEPLAPHDYHLSGLPTLQANVPFFAMGSEKGINYQGHVSPPMNFPRSLTGVFCLSTAPWIQGLAAGGDRIYARLDPNIRYKRDETLILAARIVASPADVSEMLVGDGHSKDSKHFSVRFTRFGDPVDLNMDEWSVYVIFDAAWSNESFTKMRAALTL